MQVEEILEEDWSDYDDRKKKHTDARFFSCTESWEVEYLVKKMRKRYPHLSEERIEAAIKSCCSSVSAPRPRKDFIACVMGKLGVSTPPSHQGPGPMNPPQPPGKRPVG